MASITPAPASNEAAGASGSPRNAAENDSAAGSASDAAIETGDSPEGDGQSIASLAGVAASGQVDAGSDEGTAGGDVEASDTDREGTEGKVPPVLDDLVDLIGAISDAALIAVLNTVVSLNEAANLDDVNTLVTPVADAVSVAMKNTIMPDEQEGDQPVALDGGANGAASDAPDFF
ncbi:hypothetical protein K437DRAFT_267679 [Tilletiaria anomala UBC 951]|uniref:Uncharacterized protein n=1 Tax=Tilletiaria anomala (strain ATCC 24038 / CBS 436.72 / UBC 951) TaxID=1037660 RepID=A0A066WBN1_TILAU|nr:uncharacterized protein K437DRAFT_267679 [Tilletiaria anomala UBC 951]KDN48190.1 hypothetical protein K437DRAFT_267679 [Tilletiaria anomala UBC 951]